MIPTGKELSFIDLTASPLRSHCLPSSLSLPPLFALTASPLRSHCLPSKRSFKRDRGESSGTMENEATASLGVNGHDVTSLHQLDALLDSNWESLHFLVVRHAENQINRHSLRETSANLSLGAARLFPVSMMGCVGSSSEEVKPLRSVAME
ncbi:unnamed protein product [Cyprideis torosa]|uniref:Uncharacterized protein n=1 Tax=Cyprideis torosa TaxID=163714 RepID=A0A7R8W4I5_9CRUS|nr:unnamed protein product [Cyprideis torosa]CAG0884245.1 unnamed protein product [Cyprideis torosa]